MGIKTFFVPSSTRAESSGESQLAMRIPQQDDFGDEKMAAINTGLPKSTATRRCTRRTLAVALAAFILLLGLCLGLGLGLGLGRRTSSSGGQKSPGGGGGGTPPARTRWQPAVNATWQIVLLSPFKMDSNHPNITPDVDVYDIDLFDNTNDGTSTAVIDGLHSLGKKVVCYFSGGTFEPRRPDSGQFTSADMGMELHDWPGEKWLNLRSANVASIIKARIALAAKMGCDGIDPDNLDAYDNDGGGLNLTAQDSIDFVQRILAPEASGHNLAIGLKNAGAIVNSVLSLVQFSVNEQCVEYDDCASFLPFIKAGKPVFHIEYPDGAGSSHTTVATTAWCAKDNSGTDISSFSTVLKTMGLDGWVEFCNGRVYVTEVS